MSQFKRNQRELLKEQCLQYLGGKVCKLCNNRSLPLQSYDFHHIRGAKDTEISKLISQNKAITEAIRAELDKCIILCSNCHRMVHGGFIDNETLKSLMQ